MKKTTLFGICERGRLIDAFLYNKITNSIFIVIYHLFFVAFLYFLRYMAHSEFYSNCSDTEYFSKLKLSQFIHIHACFVSMNIFFTPYTHVPVTE